MEGKHVSSGLPLVWRWGHQPRRRLGPLQALFWSALILPAALTGIIGWYSYGLVLEQAVERGERTAELLRGRALRVLESQEVAINWINTRLEGLSWQEIRDSREIHEFLKRIAGKSEHIHGLWLVPPDGRTANSADFFPVPPISTPLKRDYYKVLKERDVTYLGEMIVGRLKGNLNFNISKRRSTPDGTFDGLILVTISLDYLEAYWRRALEQEVHVAAIIRDDGSILARSPALQDLPERIASDSPFFGLSAVSDRGSYTFRAGSDGRERLYFFAKLGEFPAYTAVGLDREAVLAPWRQTLLVVGLLAVLATLTLATAVRLAQRREDVLAAEVERRRQAEATLMEKSEHLVAMERAEKRQNLISAELDHRVRNILASVQAILHLAGRSATTKEAYAAAVRGRIDAMARAHGHLTRSGWRGASLKTLIGTELKPYAGAASKGSRIRIEGPELWLRPSATVSFSLVMHELATNAAKHGALSVPDGLVTVSWVVSGAGTDRVLDIQWSETGGPPVTSPEGHGFGSRLLNTVLKHEFGADLRMEFAPEGFRLKAVLALDRLLAEGETASASATSPEPAASASSPHFAGARFLLVEDSTLPALALADALTGLGAEVVGPVGRLDEAKEAIAEAVIDVALLDVDLAGTPSYALADILAERDIPFAFLTGYEREHLPERFHDRPLLQKPVSAAALATVLRELLAAGSGGRARLGPADGQAAADLSAGDARP